MKDAILKIKVPDDFTKGNCNKCIIWHNCNAFLSGQFGVENCPLEIEEKPIDMCMICANTDCRKQGRIKDRFTLSCSGFIKEK